MFKAYQHFDDGFKWLRVVNTETGQEWDEPIKGWSLSINLMTGETLWTHENGTQYADMIF